MGQEKLKTEKYEIEVKMNKKDIETEDGGAAKIFRAVPEDNEENGLFVIIQSWDENEFNAHKDFKKFVGRKIKITIETID